ncbi:hypothetical protein GCM10008957_23590 [Deinococcus ruber]|uniref:Uncharacterized protein n=1 Tax=Deinococcus ruber TaxID=1848197 RepID=A0A918F828_9DEIO|nr:hypothetical protein GCM10008957_23590 [Deinococcus ruber]
MLVGGRVVVPSGVVEFAERVVFVPVVAEVVDGAVERGGDVGVGGELGTVRGVGGMALAGLAGVSGVPGAGLPGGGVSRSAEAVVLG